MGMMNQATPPFNGVVNVDGQPVQVTNGQATFQGQLYAISNDGSMVVTPDKHIVGYIEANNFKPMDQQQMEKLRQMGFIE